MSAILDENTQFVDTNGKPLVNGSIFIGTQNLDPEVNPKDIFSDRELTVALSNPQTLDSLGRSTNKIWTDGKFSIKIEDSTGSQIYQELDNGSTVEIGISVLDNVQGTNTITATAATTITSYVDKQQFAFTPVATNTSTVTLNIDGVGAKAVVDPEGAALSAGDLTINLISNVTYNSISDSFEILGAAGFSGTLTAALVTAGFPIQTSRATVASAATTADIFAATVPNEIDFTGTATITDFPDAPTAGISRILHCASTPTFTDNTTIFVPGGEDYTATANDIIIVHAITVSTFRLEIVRSDGVGGLAGRIVQEVNTQTGAVFSGTTIIPQDDTIPTSSEGFSVGALDVTITPESALNILQVDLFLMCNPSTAIILIASLFQDSGTAAIAVTAFTIDTDFHGVLSLRFEMVAGTTSATTFKIRAGPHATATMTINGAGGSRLWGGVNISSLTVTERLP